MSHLNVALVVRDYDAAIHFFVDGLRFELVEDTPSLTNDGRPKRWSWFVQLEVGQAFCSRVPTATSKQAWWASNSPVASGCSCASTISTSRYQRMVAAGVRFVSPPRDEPYGRLAVFLDLEGNRWDLLGPDPRR